MSRGLHVKHRGSCSRARQSSPAVLLFVGIVLAAAGVASAYFVENDSGSYGLATAGVIGPPTAFSAVAASPTSVTLSWDAPSNPSPTGYSLSQSSGTLAGCAASPSAVTTTCTATGLTPGTSYTWTLSAEYYSWTSASTGSGATPPKETPTIKSTTSSASLTVGGSLDDRSVISGGYGPGGTITWQVYVAGDTSCSGTAYFTSAPQSVNNDSTYSSGAYASDEAGSYIWGFSYTGDASNNPVRGCGGTSESFTVNKASPGLDTSAFSFVDVGQSVTDSAVLSNGYDPTGTIIYTLYGPSPTASCSTVVGQVTSSSLSGNGSYTSPPITPTEAGTYWWTTNYAGDQNNQATSNGCGATGESSVVQPLTPVVSTSADPAALTFGGSAADQASISGYSPTGTITFSLYASTDTSCATALYTSTQAVNGNSTYTSGSYAPNAGSYIWGFSYSGDTDNYPVSGCGGDTETLVVNAASTSFTISVNAGESASIVYGSEATIAESGLAVGATGTVTFVSVTPVAMLCSVSYPAGTSCATTTLAAGTYSKIMAVFSDSDGNYEDSASTNSASLTVNPASVSLSLSAPATGTANTTITASSVTASLSGGVEESGTINFTVFGPSTSAPSACSSGGVSVGTGTPVSGDGIYEPTAGFTPAAPGDYWWFVSFTDTDGNNSAAASLCPPITETVVSGASH